MKKYLKALIVLFVIGILSIVGASSAMAVPAESTAYAVANGNTLTFYYDGASASHLGSKWLVGDGSEAASAFAAVTSWQASSPNITEVVFDDSFASYNQVVTTSKWFNSFIKLVTITSLTNLNTSSVTSMSGMFEYCSSLTSLDLSNFNTSNVTNMSGMFINCKSLKTLDLSNFNTVALTDMNNMFPGCTSLQMIDLSSFNTASVTNIANLFYNCCSLTTIYASDKFITDKVKEYVYHSMMFASCTSLVGSNGTSYASMRETNPASANDKTFAKIDQAGQPGYFSSKDHVPVNEVNPYWNWFNKNNKNNNGKVKTVTETIEAQATEDKTETKVQTLTTNGGKATTPGTSDNGYIEPVVTDTAKNVIPMVLAGLGITFVGLITALVLYVGKKN